VITLKIIFICPSYLLANVITSSFMCALCCVMNFSHSPLPSHDWLSFHFIFIFHSFSFLANYHKYTLTVSIRSTNFAYRHAILSFKIYKWINEWMWRKMKKRKIMRKVGKEKKESYIERISEKKFFWIIILAQQQQLLLLQRHESG
jgi:hypothetical protein